MERSTKYLDYVSAIAACYAFLKNADSEKKQLFSAFNEYEQLLVTNNNVLSKFPALIAEISQTLSITNYNSQTAVGKNEELKKAFDKLAYISDVLDDLDEFNNASLEAKLKVSVYKSNFKASSLKLTFRSIETLHFEMKKFEQLFSNAASALNTEAQKRQKLKSVMAQDVPLLVQFPIINAELGKISGGENIGSYGIDYALNNYVAIRSNLSRLNEFSAHFSKLSKDYLLILSNVDLQAFPAIKSNTSLNSLSGDFLKFDAKATECKNRIIKLDTLRAQFTTLRRELPGKLDDLSANHKNYVLNEAQQLQELLFDKLGVMFEKAEQKINTIKELLKKEFRDSNQKISEALFLRQTIAKYESLMWAENTASLNQELECFSNGTSRWRKEDFESNIQQNIRQKNEAIEDVKNEFSLFLSKNRDYKNRLEKIINTKSSLTEMEGLISDMGGLKFLKGAFYKYLK